MSDINNQNDSDSVITIVRSVKPRELGKTYHRINGQIIKMSIAHVSTGICESKLVRTGDDLKALLEQVVESEDLAIILGHFVRARSTAWKVEDIKELISQLGGKQ
jgi:hypothetical protein